MVVRLWTKGRLFVLVACCNAVTVLIFVAYISPQQLPFMQRSQQQRIIMGNMTPGTPHDNSQNSVVITGKPSRIHLPSVGVDLPVTDGIYNSKHQSWSLSSDKAHYATITPPLNNQRGNTFIYGHNHPQVFAGLMDIGLGDKAYVHTDGGLVFVYELQLVKDVAPRDVSVFEGTSQPTLTIQTCAGTWYEDRRLFSFRFVSVSRGNGS
jgi:LPXTG-site transpeptidase (sortase) family protein